MLARGQVYNSIPFQVPQMETREILFQVQHFPCGKLAFFFPGLSLQFRAGYEGCGVTLDVILRPSNVWLDLVKKRKKKKLLRFGAMDFGREA